MIWTVLFVVGFFGLMSTSAVASGDLSGSTGVCDVKANYINVRSGPGLQHQIIARQNNDADVVSYSNSSPLEIDGYSWKSFYYYDPSQGQYTTERVGYMAIQAPNSQILWVRSAGNAKNTFHSNVTIYDYPFVNSIGSIKPNEYVAAAGMAGYPSLYIRANVDDPNAWYIRQPSTATDGWAFGWVLNAAYGAE